MSEIVQFYKDQTIFLTGATGALGKVYIEKLLRVCHDVKKIYVLVRSKKDVNADERMNSFFDGICFNRLRGERPNFKEKIALVRGNCEESGLGLNNEDLTVLIREVTIFVHAAANVNFDQSLRSAAYNNVRATREALELAKKMTKLDLFIYVSTAFANCPKGYIEEKFYDPPMTGENLLQLVDLVDDDVLAKITPSLLGDWPNTYVYSKAIAEDLVKRQAGVIKAIVVRPAIITNAMREPVPGFIDSIHGFAGMVIATSLGVFRVFPARPTNIMWITPVDYVANNIIAIGWNTRKSDAAIFNYVGFRITIGPLMEHLKNFRSKCVLDNVLWYPGFTFTTNRIVYNLTIFWLYKVIPYIADTVASCFGKKLHAVKAASRFSNLLEKLHYFFTNQFDFETGNVEELRERMNEDDKKLFNFSMVDVDFDKYLVTGFFEMRRNLLKQKDENLPRARVRLLILGILYYGLTAVLCCLCFRVLFI